MKIELSLILLFGIINAVLSERVYPNIGYIQCNSEDPSVTQKCIDVLRAKKSGPFRFLNISNRNTFRFSYLGGSCADGVDYARTKIPGCEQCNALGKPPVDTAPSCVQAHPYN